MRYIEPLAKVIAELGKLPSVGEKTASRYAYALLNAPDEDIEALCSAIQNLKKNVHFCSVCGNFSEQKMCELCASRSAKIICVVKEPRDILALERVKDFKGVYHVLHGVISPMQGIGINDIKIRELLQRLNDEVQEVILATNPDVEGEATALYIAKLVKPLGIKVTRLARGLPEGSVIEFADEGTLSRALSSRIEL